MSDYVEMAELSSSEQQILNSSKPDVLQDLSLQSIMRKSFKAFSKPKTFDKIRSFSDWVDLPKDFQGKTMYDQICQFQFFEDTVFVIQKEAEVSCLDFSTTKQIISVGLANGTIILVNSKTGVTTHSFFGDNIKVNDLILGEKNIYSCGESGYVKIWDYSGENVHKFEGNEGPMMALALSSDEKYLAMGDDKGKVMLYTLENYNVMGTFEVKDALPITFILFTPDNQQIMVSNESNSFDLRSFPGLEIKSSFVHEDKIKKIAISSKGEFLASVSADKIVKIWNFADKTERKTLEIDANCVAFMQKDDLLITGNQDNSIKIWDKDGNLKSTIQGHTGPITALKMSKRGHLLISGSSDKTIRGWNLDKLKNVDLLQGNNSPFSALVTIPNTSFVISAGDESNLIVWNIDKSNKVLELDSGCEKGVKSLAVNGEGTKLVSGNNDGGLSLWEMDMSRIRFNKLGTIAKHKDVVLAVIFTHKSEYIISMGQDQSLVISNAMDLKRTSHEISKYNGVGSGLALYSNDTTIVTGGKSGVIFILEYLTLKTLKELIGHNNEITVLRTTENLIVSASRDSTIKIWNSSNGLLIRTLMNHEKAVTCMEVSQDYHKIITGSEDQTIRLWNLDIGSQLGIEKFDNPIRVLALESKETRIIADGIDKNNLKIIDVNKIKTSKILGNYEGEVKCLALSKDESLLFTGDNNNIRVWDLDTHKYTEIKGHSNIVNKLKLTPDETRLISCGADNSARIWDIKDLKNITLIKVFKNFSNWVNDVAIYDQGKKAAFACSDCGISHFDLETLQYRDDNCVHRGEVHCLAVLNDQTLYSGGNDNRILIIDLGKLKYKEELGRHDGCVQDLIVTSDNLKLVSGSRDNTIKVWDLKSKKVINVMKEHTNRVTSIVLDSDGNKLFSGSWDKTIRIWDMKNYKQLGILEGTGGNVNGLALSRDNMRLFSASSEKTCRRWELSDSKFIDFNDGHYGSINRIDISPDGKYLYTVGYDQLVIVWDLIMKKQKTRLKEHTWTIFGVCVNTDGSKAVTCTYNSTIILWDLKKERYLWKLRIGASMNFIIFSHDDKEIVAACCDSLIRVFDVKYGKELRKFEDGHSSTVCRVLLTPDDKFLISCSADKLVIIWDYKTCQKLNVLQSHTKEVEALALITQKGLMKLVSGSYDETIKIWNMEKGECEKTEKYASIIQDIVVTEDNKKLIIGSEKSIIILDVQTFMQIQTFQNDKFKIIDIMVTKDSKKLFIAGGKSVEVYKEKDGQYVRDFNLTEGFNASFGCAVMSPNQKMLIYSERDNNIHVWDFHGSHIASNNTHKKLITSIIMAEDNDLIISASLDGKICIYSLIAKEIKKEIKAHPPGVTALALSKISQTQKMISAGEDMKIRIWSYPNGEKINEFQTFEDIISSIVILSGEEQFLTGGNKKRLTVWNMSDGGSQNICVLSEKVKGLKITPDNNILIIYLANSIMQIWDTMNYSFINQIPMDHNNYNVFPIFLSTKNCRLMLYFNKIIDCMNGEVIFNFNANTEMLAFFFDFESNSYYYISKYFELYKFDLYWLQTYFYQYMKYDSLTSLNKQPENFIKRTSSTYPFFFSYLHLVSIFDRPEFFTVELLESIYNEKVDISHFFTLDIFMNTPLDIILLKKNITLLNKYFILFFFYFAKENVSFFQKVRFMNYRFRPNYDILDIMSNIIDLCSPDLSIISKILQFSLVPFDPSLYDNSLSFRELQDPLHITTDSIYIIDKDYIDVSLKEIFANIDKMENNAKSEEVEQNKSVIKAKIISIPGICNINNEKTEKIFSALADCEPDNEIFSNQVLENLALHIWFSQIKWIFIADFLIFFLFFALYNINFICIYPLRTDIYYAQEDIVAKLDLISIIIDALLILYSLFMLINELRQFSTSGFVDYFKSIWNYFDIFLIPSLLATSILDIIRVKDPGELDSDLRIFIKLISAFAMFCFWFRFLSFSRALTDMASMIRLIFTVISKTKYFVIFMVMFILTLSATFYLMHNDNLDENPSFWDTILVFFSSTIGDTSGITDYDLVESNLKDYFLIFSSFLFAIILLNLLVSIIGDIHGEIKESGEKTRLYELINILVDTNFSLTANIIRFFKGKGEEKAYLIQVFNEKHEEKEVDVYEHLEKHLEEKVKEIVTAEKTKIVDEIEEKIASLMQSEFEKIKQYLEKKGEANK